MYGDVITQVPTVVYSLLAGSLSDKYGRGLLLICPIIGQILEGAALLVNKIWFTALPLEAWVNILPNVLYNDFWAKMSQIRFVGDKKVIFYINSLVFQLIMFKYL